MAVLAAGFAFAAAPGSAQDSFTGSFFGTSKPVSATVLPLSVSGTLVVSFHGNVASGCAARGLCDYTGSVTVRPATRGDIVVVNYKLRRHISEQVTVEDDGPGSGTTTSQVERADQAHPAGQCMDVQQLLGFATTSGQGRRVTMVLMQAGDGVLSTRCAGPVDGDIANVSPRVVVRRTRLLRGRMRISLAGTRQFAAAGLAGTVRSTIEWRIGKPKAVSPSPLTDVKNVKLRDVHEVLHVVSATGRLAATVNPTGDSAACARLDACGLTETFVAPVSRQGAIAGLDASGPAKRPYLDFLTALGLARGGNPRGIQVSGYVYWKGGRFLATAQQSGSCRDTGSLEASVVSIAAAPGRVTGSYSAGTDFRTRCPGPFVGPEQVLATGAAPRSTLRRHTFTLELGGIHRFHDDTYSGESQSRLSIVLRRGRLSQHVSIIHVVGLGF